MIWRPKYTISNQLLMTIREIGESIGQIKAQCLDQQVLAKLEIDARELSSHASTSIEGNPLPLTDVKRLLKTQKSYVRDTEREVLNYNAALQALYKSVSANQFELSLSVIEQVQGQVVDKLMQNPSHCGALRQEAVLIRNPRQVDEIVFIPPDAKDVSPLLLALIDYIKAHIGVVDPIILAGIFHRQHVIIHPFMDGNGRTTRLLTTAILGYAGLDLFTIFSFENYYNRNISRYFQSVGLQGDYYDLADDVDFSDWLLYFSEGILDELRRVIKLLPGATQGPRLEPHHQQLLAYIQAHGSITQREYGQISTRSLAARKLDIDKLLTLGLIMSRGKGRGTYYTLPD